MQCACARVATGMPTNVDKSVDKSENLSGIKELSKEEAEQMSKLSRDICRVMAGYSSMCSPTGG